MKSNHTQNTCYTSSCYKSYKSYGGSEFIELRSRQLFSHSISNHHLSLTVHKVNHIAVMSSSWYSSFCTIYATSLSLADEVGWCFGVVTSPSPPGPVSLISTSPLSGSQSPATPASSVRLSKSSVTHDFGGLSLDKLSVSHVFNLSMWEMIGRLCLDFWIR